MNWSYLPYVDDYQQEGGMPMYTRSGEADAGMTKDMLTKQSIQYK